MNASVSQEAPVQEQLVLNVYVGRLGTDGNKFK